MERNGQNILKTTIMFLISGGATAAVLYLLFRNINFPTLRLCLQKADPKFLVTALLISMAWNIGLYALIRRKIWQYMGYVVSFPECLFIRAGSLPFQAIPSFKDTGLAMALYLKKRFSMPLSDGILSNIVVNFFSLTGLLFLMMLGYITSGPGSTDLSVLEQHLTAKLIPIFLFIVFILYAFYFNPALGKRILFYACFKKRDWLYGIFERNINLWKGLPRQDMITFFLLATFFKLAEVLIFYSLAQAYQLNIPGASIVLYVPLAMMISESPANISGIGVREGALVLFFYHSAPKEILVAIAILIFIINRMAPIIIGLFFLVPFLSKMQLSFAKIKEHMRQHSIHSI
ncbi:MAG: lysylphosphatidylglycerol synthase transmembrane domain-containing protein [Candidatus Omnitrophota bacterium]|jgi:hypothetical protein